MAKFAKKNSIIDVVQFTGDNLSELEAFCTDSLLSSHAETPKYYIKSGTELIELNQYDWVVQNQSGFCIMKNDELTINYEAV